MRWPHLRRVIEGHIDGAPRRTQIGILVYEGVDLLDVAVPYELFGWAAAADSSLAVRLVAARAGQVTTRDHFRFEANDEIHDCPPLDVVWVPGADPKFLADAMTNAAILDFLRRQALVAQFVVSVCEGALILAAAGLLDGYEATTHWAFLPCFAQVPEDSRGGRLPAFRRGPRSRDRRWHLLGTR